MLLDIVPIATDDVTFDIDALIIEPENPDTHIGADADTSAVRVGNIRFTVVTFVPTRKISSRPKLLLA